MTAEQSKAQAAIEASQMITTKEIKELAEKDLIKLLK